MYIYNVTINVDESIHKEWILWMRETHIPEVLGTGKFTKALMSEVLVNEDMGGITYSVQYTCSSRELLMRYYQEDAAKLRKATQNKFGDKFGAFRTEMKIVQEYLT